MNKEMLEIINCIKTTWSKDEIIRFLYIKLAPFFHRDLLFFCQDIDEKYRQFKEGFTVKLPYVVCSTLADFYVRLFEDFGIEAQKIIATSSKIPLFAIIVRGESGYYFIDPLNDLVYNQYGLKPLNFGIIPNYKTIRNNYPHLVTLDQSYLKEIDETLKLAPVGGYLDETFNELSKKILNRNDASKYFAIPKDKVEEILQAKIELLNQKFINLGQVNGAYERILLYFYLFRKTLNKSEDAHVKTFLGPNEGQKANVFIRIEEGNDKDILYEEVKEDKQFVLKRIH